MAVVPLKPKSVAVDTNVLFDLANGDEEAHLALAVIRARLPNVNVVVTPTVVQELSWLAEHADEPETKRLAILAATSLEKWGISAANCRSVMHGIIEQAANEISRRGLIPPNEVHDALIVAEASSAQCSMLISTDGHMWKADFTVLNGVLVGRDLYPIVLVSPRKIIKDYG